MNVYVDLEKEYKYSTLLIGLSGGFESSELHKFTTTSTASFVQPVHDREQDRERGRVHVADLGTRH
jgi:hypothetical protein